MKKITLNDSWVDDLAALCAYLFLILAVFVERGWEFVPIEIAIAVVGAAFIGRVVYVICRQGNGRGRPATWRSILAGALYWVLLTVILGRDFPAAWVFWTMAGLFAAGAIGIRLTEK